MEGLWSRVKYFVKERFFLVCVSIFAVFFIYLFIFKIDANVKVGVIALFGSMYVAIYSHGKNREREIASRLFPEKKVAYETIFKLIFDIMYSIKYPSKKDEKAETKRILELKRQLMVWGSGEAISCFNDLETASAVQGNSNAFVLKYEELVRILRKDLGHDDSNLRPGNLLGIILTPEDKTKLIGS